MAVGRFCLHLILFGLLAAANFNVCNAIQQFQEHQKLNMTLYYESQCPDCDGFIANDLYPTWKKINGDEYLNLELVPYGNARTKEISPGTYEIICQHGPTECKGNVLHNCALKYIPTKDLQIGFIACTFFATNPSKAGILCAKLLKIDFSEIGKCAESDEGQKLHYLAGVKTSKLNPTQKYVPWIIFNGIYNQQEMDSAQQNFIKFLCTKLDSMKIQLPEQCQQL